MNFPSLRRVPNVNADQPCSLVELAAFVSPTVVASVFPADAALASSRFRVGGECGLQIAVASAQPLYNNGQIKFRISKSAAGAALQVRFKPSGKPRFSTTQVLRQLNEVQAGVGLTQLVQQEAIPRLKGWAFFASTYVATFALSETCFSRIETGFLDFDLELPQTVKDVHPGGSADTSDRGALMRRLKPWRPISEDRNLSMIHRDARMETSQLRQAAGVDFARSHPSIRSKSKPRGGGCPTPGSGWADAGAGMPEMWRRRKPKRHILRAPVGTGSADLTGNFARR